MIVLGNPYNNELNPSVEVSTVEVTANGVAFGDWIAGPSMPYNALLTHMAKSEADSAFYFVGGQLPNGTITDIDGNFSLTVKDQSAILLVSYTGYEAQEIAVLNDR